MYGGVRGRGSTNLFLSLLDCSRLYRRAVVSGGFPAANGGKMTERNEVQIC